MSARIGFDLVVLLAVASAPALAQQPEGLPPVFSTIGYDEAVARTKSGDKILVVKATATWCAPCKMMDRTTWRDEKVVAWFKEHGLAIQFDVDKERELAKSLAIQAMPTMVAFVKGQEFDRLVGAKDATEFLAWIDGVKQGKRSIDAVRARARSAAAGTLAEVEARYELAGALVHSGDLDGAAEEYAWAWVHSKNVPAYAGVRGSFMASAMAALARRHQPARARFMRLRDEAGEQLQGEKVDKGVLSDWIDLNEMVGEQQQSLEWFDRVKADPKWLPLLREASRKLEDVLETNQRWADIAGLSADPLGKVRSDHARLAMTLGMASFGEDEVEQREFQALNERMFREGCGKLYACLLAAGRDEQARQVADEAIKLDDTSALRVALVRWALTTKQPRPEQVALLDEAQKNGDAKAVAKLKVKLEKALALKSEH